MLRSGGGILAVFLGSSLLAGCGGGSSEGTVVVAPDVEGLAASTPPSSTKITSADSWMNFVLAIQYVGAQFYGAASGSPLPAALQGGTGTQGSVSGGRSVAFANPLIGQYAGEFAADQIASITAIRQALGTAAGAQPTVDLSSSAFGRVGEAAGLGSGFDPFADETSFLLGALVIEHGVAAGYRAMLTEGVAADAEGMLTKAMGDSIYRDGVIRALLATRAEETPALADTVSAVFAVLAALQTGDSALQVSQSGDQPVADVPDGNGYPIALVRNTDEMLRLLSLNPSATSGGLLPQGINGTDLVA
ncbi:ferritin-like domain-containing protein [Sphingomonas sp. PL-96]|uniref:ferritin-like domain-containing protein n=1 Tax=Sphingomonas sp. PL-96 TaxID=2887201 RepID=UPI001E391E17|nr:ferritin-like domain-containing protein [Sphingomonas sp. PL-96]MCC2976593.1 ferritin-like domain-containing protein [Sphingomonas sp. PL-96]